MSSKLPVGNRCVYPSVTSRRTVTQRVHRETVQEVSREPLWTDMINTLRPARSITRRTADSKARKRSRITCRSTTSATPTPAPSWLRRQGLPPSLDGWLGLPRADRVGERPHRWRRPRRTHPVQLPPYRGDSEQQPDHVQPLNRPNRTIPQQRRGSDPGRAGSPPRRVRRLARPVRLARYRSSRRSACRRACTHGRRPTDIRDSWQSTRRHTTPRARRAPSPRVRTAKTPTG
jgi:hypothetical protein